MTECAHENGIWLENVNLLNEDAIRTALEHGNLAYIQQIEDESAIRNVVISTHWCPNCNAIYGEITAAA